MEIRGNRFNGRSWTTAIPTEEMVTDTLIRDVLHGLSLEHYLTIELREPLSIMTCNTSLGVLSRSILSPRRFRGTGLTTVLR